MNVTIIAISQRVAPVRERLGRWWDGLSGRERLLVSILAGIALSALLLTAVVNPLRAARREALATIRVHDTLQAGLLAAGSGGGVPQRSGDPAAILSGSAGTSGITVTQVAPEGRGARAELADVSFEALLRWIAEVERTSALRIASADVRPAATPGLVTARLVFTQ